MNILITGASSYVGAKIYSDLKTKHNIVGTYFNNKLFPELEPLDIRQIDDVKRIFENKKPDIVIHVAANPSAAWCKDNPDEARAINLIGTKNIVETANIIDAKVIYISSMATMDENSLYGKMKVEGEEIVKTAKNGYAILRPSLIIGLSPNTTNDRPFNRLLKNITEHTPAVYDNSWNFQPTWLNHISQAIEIIIDNNITNEVIPICVPEIITRFDIARDILSDFGINVISEDKNDASPTLTDDQNKLRELNLPIYSYEQMIHGIKNDIKKYLENNVL